VVDELSLPDREVRSLPRRFALGVLAPQLLFYLGLRSGGLGAALVVAGGWTAGLQIYELVRRRILDPFLVYGILFALMQGAAALSTRNPAVYAGAGVVENAVWSALLLGSAVFCRPLLSNILGLMIGEQAIRTVPMQGALWLLTLLWGGLFLIRSVGLYIALIHLTIGQFLVINTVAGWPLNGLGVIMSLLYLRQRLRKASTGRPANLRIVSCGTAGIK